ncbi:hypothetical protein ABIE18_000145 [Arthrobacter sp. 2762]
MSLYLTLITVAANPDFIVQLSDRRLTTADGGIFTEDETKVIYIQTPSWQVVMGYTGLARFGRQPTNQVLMELMEAALLASNHQIDATFEKFRELITEKWKKREARQAGVHARLSIVITGFTLDGDARYRGPFQWLITNFQDWGVADHAAPWPEFKNTFLSPVGEWPTVIQRVGAYQALPQTQVEELRGRLDKGVPASAVTDSMLNLLPGQSRAFPTVGTRANSVIIRPYMEPEGSYHSFEEVRAIHMFDSIQVDSAGEIMMMFQPTVEQVSPGTGFITDVPKRQPCPCGSGMQYRRCHGKVPSKAKAPVARNS